MRSSFLTLLGVVLAAVASTANACPGIDHEHGLRPRSQRGATQPSGGASVVRPITWGDINVIHTTDIHGWYQGHLKSSQPEPNYSGDWGDFASFISHMRKLAKQKGVDLLLVDTGDLHDGAGLSDAAHPIAGHATDNLHSQIRYDALAVGNHELYLYNIAHDTYTSFRPQQNVKGVNRYMASNVNITLQEGGKNVTVPMGERFIKFKTDFGRKVTSMGVLFDFTGQDQGLYVQKVEDMVNEQWFNEAIAEQPDLFLLTGHMPVSKDKWPLVVNKIRALHPDVPIMVLGGHTHIRDCTQYDSNSMGLESGRYLETIGWLSANASNWARPQPHGPPPHPGKPGKPGKPGRRDAPAPGAAPAAGPASPDSKPTGPITVSFSRSYIDANRRNYAIHAGLTEQRFDTPEGVRISNEMQKQADQLDLSHVYGIAPQDYYLSRVAPSDSHSVLNLLTNDVLPTVVSTSNPGREHVPSIVVANSGAIRFDLLAGNFTRNDQYIVSPFLDKFLYVQNVEWQYAQQVVGKLNAQGAYRRSEPSAQHTGEAYARGEVEHIYEEWRRSQFAMNADERRHIAELDARADAKLVTGSDGATLGYVTTDSCGSTPGDDTVHTAIPYAAQPDYVQSPPTQDGATVTPAATDPVDLVVVDFIIKPTLAILNSLQTAHTYTNADVQPYNSLTTQDIFPLYAEKAWN